MQGEQGAHGWVPKLPHVHGVVMYPALCIPSGKETNSAAPCSQERGIWPSSV